MFLPPPFHAHRGKCTENAGKRFTFPWLHNVDYCRGPSGGILPWHCGGKCQGFPRNRFTFPPVCAGEPISACLRPDRTNPILSASDGLVENAGTRTDLYLRKFTDMFNIFYILRLIIGRIGWRNDRMGLQ